MQLFPEVPPCTNFHIIHYVHSFSFGGAAAATTINCDWNSKTWRHERTTAICPGSSCGGSGGGHKHQRTCGTALNQLLSPGNLSFTGRGGLSTEHSFNRIITRVRPLVWWYFRPLPVCLSVQSFSGPYASHTNGKGCYREEGAAAATKGATCPIIFEL